MGKVTRRSFVTTVGAASVASATVLLTAPSAVAAGAPATAKVPSDPATVYLFFTADEARFIEAASV